MNKILILCYSLFTHKDCTKVKIVFETVKYSRFGLADRGVFLIFLVYSLIHTILRKSCNAETLNWLVRLKHFWYCSNWYSVCSKRLITQSVNLLPSFYVDICSLYFMHFYLGTQRQKWHPSTRTFPSILTILVDYG